MKKFRTREAIGPEYRPILFRLFLFILLLIFAVSCHRPVFYRLNPAEERDFKKILVERWAKIFTFRGDAKLLLEADDRYYPGKAALAMARPDRVRADFFDPFGQTKGQVIINGGLLNQDLNQGVGWEESPSLEMILLDRLSRLGGGDPAEDLGALLLGQPLGMIEEARLLGVSEFDKSRLERPAENEKTFFITFVDEEPVISGILVFDGYEDQFVIMEYENYERVSGILLPRKVTIDLQDRKVRLTIRYRQLEINIEMPEDIFDTGRS